MPFDMSRLLMGTVQDATIRMSDGTELALGRGSLEIEIQQEVFNHYSMVGGERRLDRAIVSGVEIITHLRTGEMNVTVPVTAPETSPLAVLSGSGLPGIRMIRMDRRRNDSPQHVEERREEDSSLVREREESSVWEELQALSE